MYNTMASLVVRSVLPSLALLALLMVNMLLPSLVHAPVSPERRGVVPTFNCRPPRPFLVDPLPPLPEVPLPPLPITLDSGALLKVIYFLLYSYLPRYYTTHYSLQAYWTRPLSDLKNMYTPEYLPNAQFSLYRSLSDEFTLKFAPPSWDVILARLN